MSPFRRGATSGRILFMAYFGTVAEGLVFLLLTPFLLRRLGPAMFGLWALGLSLTDWLQLLDFGLREAMLKFAAAHQALGRRTEIRPLAETLLGFYVAISAVTLVVGGVFAWVAVPVFVDDPAARATLRTAVGLLALSAAISFPLGIAGSLLEGLLRFDLLNLFLSLHAVTRLVLIVFALQLGYGVVGVAAAELAGRLVLHAVRWRALARLYPEVVPRRLSVAAGVREFVDFGVWNAIRQIVEVATTRMYEPLLAMFAGLPSVGAFWAGRRLATIPAEAIGPLASVLFPLSSELDAAGRRAQLGDSLLKATKFAWTLSVPIAMVLSLGAAPIQTNWLAGRAPEAEGVLQVFAAVFLAVAVTLPAESILLGIGRVRMLALCGVAQAILTLGLGVALTGAYGARGLAWAALAGVVLGQAAVQLPHAARVCGLRVRPFLARALGPGLAIGIPVGLVAWAFRDRVALGGLAALGAWAGGTLLAYALLFWRFGLDSEERDFIRVHARRIFVSLDPTGPA